MEAYKRKTLKSFKRKYPNADFSKFGVDVYSRSKGARFVQNLALSPSTWLMPSNVIILKKKKIAGYNNILKTETKSMRFGVNNGLNYNKPSHRSKVRQDWGEHWETLGGNTSTSTTHSTPADIPKNVKRGRR